MTIATNKTVFRVELTAASDGHTETLAAECHDYGHAEQLLDAYLQAAAGYVSGRVIREDVTITRTVVFEGVRK